MTYEQAIEKAGRLNAAGVPTRVRKAPIPGGYGTWTVTAQSGIHWAHAHPEGVRRGEKVNTAKLTEHEVRQIRARHALEDISVEALGRQYGVSGTMISYIVKRRNWKHVA
jgi:hypothetical protein